MPIDLTLISPIPASFLSAIQIGYYTRRVHREPDPNPRDNTRIMYFISAAVIYNVINIMSPSDIRKIIIAMKFKG